MMWFLYGSGTYKYLFGITGEAWEARTLSWVLSLSSGLSVRFLLLSSNVEFWRIKITKRGKKYRLRRLLNLFTFVDQRGWPKEQVPKVLSVLKQVLNHDVQTSPYFCCCILSFPDCFGVNNNDNNILYQHRLQRMEFLSCVLCQTLDLNFRQ